MRTTAFVAALALASAAGTAARAEGPTGPGAAVELEWHGQSSWSEQSSDVIVNNAVPGLRFDQTTAGGRPAQIWDFRDDASGVFRLVDKTGGGARPLKIESSTPSFSFVMQRRTGNIGLRTSTPAASLHLRRSDGSTYVLIVDTSNVPATRNFLALSNRGASTVRLDDSSGGPTWAFGSLASGNFFVTSMGLAFTLTTAGNATIAGTLSQLSDRNAKRDVEALDADALLERVAGLPLSAWSYTGDQARHVGPMAQDFSAAFGLGTDERHVAPADVAGVGLVAVQALRERIGGLERELQGLEARLAARDAGLRAARARLAAVQALPRGAQQ